MIGLVRKIVAGPKNRTTWNGIQLDLTYITERLIAMAYPASGFQKTYRNSIQDVSQYFKQKHNNKCLVINVSMRKYNYQYFKNNVKDYFWPDHQAPPLTTIFIICQDMFEFLKENQGNVVAVHCNHGKGRTGTCIIAYMLFMRQFQGAREALEFYNKRRFIKDTYGVDQPCQRRYLGYFQHILKQQKIPHKLKCYKLLKIRQTGLDLKSNFLQLSLTRSTQTKHTKLSLNQILKNNSVPLMSDIFIQIYQLTWTGQSQAVRINFNLNFLQQTKQNRVYSVEFNGSQVCVNGGRTRLFTLTLFFQEYCQCHLGQKLECQCVDLRMIQEKEWGKMIDIIERNKKTDIEQLDKYVYGKNQTKITNSKIMQQQPIQTEQPIKQLYD